MRATFESFRDTCYQQGVELEPRLPRFVADKIPSSRYYYTPGKMLQAVAAAGWLLGEEPDLALVSDRIDVSSFHDEDVPAHILARILNASHEPEEAEDYARYFICKDGAEIDNCVDADTYFAETVAVFVEPGQDKGCQIIADGMEPVFLRKSIGEHSALALHDIRINGIPYPAGSIARVDVSQDVVQSTNGELFFDFPCVSDDRVETVPVETVMKARFMRLSAFAMSPDERGDFSELCEYSFPSRVSRAAQMTIEAVRDAVRCHTSGAIQLSASDSLVHTS